MTSANTIAFPTNIHQLTHAAFNSTFKLNPKLNFQKVAGIEEQYYETTWLSSSSSVVATLSQGRKRSLSRLLEWSNLQIVSILNASPSKRLLSVQTTKVSCVNKEQARREWKSLRDMFTKHLKKVEPTASSDDDAEKPRAYNGKWKYFHSLSFLTNIKIDGTADDSNEPVAPKEDDKVEILDASQIVVCQLSTNKVDEKPKIAPNLISSLDLQRRPLEYLTITGATIAAPGEARSEVRNGRTGTPAIDGASDHRLNLVGPRGPSREPRRKHFLSFFSTLGSSSRADAPGIQNRV
ncbi:unnamed protein product [Nesidiocoris tenuis]|uniref:MADF domain-containing protein n=1 Tax=Nesidiocoris tenuis TaxID=355587 RepID=A0A6H5FWH8_9HEMI|nr:unnamed protein product [Nesidiocoris tenuis]